VSNAVVTSSDGFRQTIRQHETELRDRTGKPLYNVIPLSRHEPHQTIDGTYLQAWLNVYLRRRAGEDESLVYIRSEETAEELLLILSEASELHRLLGSLIETAKEVD
jgi:hypothetical protein